MQYHPPSGSTDSNAPYVGKNVAAGIIGSKIPPGMPEYTQREIVNAISLSGQTPTDTDLNQLTRAIRGGQLDFAPDNGTANALVATLGLAHNAMRAGLPFKVLKGGSANSSTTPTLTLTGPNGANAITGVITKCDGSAVAPGDLPANAMLILISDGANWRLLALLTKSDVLALIQANTLTLLRANVTVYVRPDGSDGNSGLADTAAGAFKTPTGAYSALARLYILSGYSIAIQLSKTYAPGVVTTYPGLIASQSGLSGAITIQGDPANPQNHALLPAVLADGTSACVASAIQSLLVSGVTLDGSTITSGSPIRGLTGGAVNRQNCIVKFSGAQSSVAGIQLDPGSSTTRTGAETVLGQGATINAYVVANAGASDNGSTSAAALTVSSLALVSGWFQIIQGTALLGATTFSATGVSGPRYNITDNGVLRLGTTAESAIPGSTAGTATQGGRVDGGLGADWTVFTPGLSVTSGSINGTASGIFRKSDRRVDFILIVSVASVASPGAMIVGHPGSLSPALVPGFAATCVGRDTGQTGKGVTGSIANGSTNMSVQNSADNTTPAVAGAQITINGFYETAA